MASTIAAVTTSGGGVVTTADASGNLNLLAGTTTVVALTNAGAAVSGTLSNTTGATFATSSGSVGIGTGSPSAKLHSYATSGTTTTLGRFEAAIGSYTGTSLIAANTLGASSTYNLFSCIADSDGDAGGPFTQFLVRGDGNVGIGTSSPSSLLNVVSTSSSGVSTGVFSNANNSLFIRNGGGTIAYLTSDSSVNNAWGMDSTSNYVAAYTGNGTERMRIDSSGNFDFKSGLMTSTGTQNNTTGAGANMFISAGQMYRSTSSLKYKKNVENATHGLVDLLKLRPVTYEGKAEADDGKTFGGLIAEEVHEAGLTEFVQYAEDGSPDALAYGNMVSLCVKAIQELKSIIDTQANTITALTDRIAALEAK